MRYRPLTMFREDPLPFTPLGGPRTDLASPHVQPPHTRVSASFGSSRQSGSGSEASVTAGLGSLGAGGGGEREGFGPKSVGFPKPYRRFS